MHPMIYIPILPSLQIPRSPSDSSLPSWDPNLLGAFHGWDNLLWHLDAFGPLSFVDLLVGLDCYHLSILFLLDQIWCSGFFVHLVDVGVGDFTCWLLLIPGLHLTLVILVAFLVAWPTNHGLCLSSLVHSYSGVILCRLGFLALPFLSYKALPRWATSCLNCSFTFAISFEQVSITTFSTRTWLQGLELSIKSKQEVEASFLMISKKLTKDAPKGLPMFSSLLFSSLLCMLRIFVFSSKFSIASWELANLALSFSFFFIRLSLVVEDGALDYNSSILVVSSQFKFANVSNFSNKHL
jgi:hypothetical protein